jgi:hypothetical protein
MKSNMYICTYHIAAHLSALLETRAEALSSPFLASYSATPRAFFLVSLTAPDPSPILRADPTRGPAR